MAGKERHRRMEECEKKEWRREEEKEKRDVSGSTGKGQRSER